MNIKQFLKPDWRKIVIFGVLFVFVSFYFNICINWYDFVAGYDHIICETLMDGIFRTLERIFHNILWPGYGVWLWDIALWKAWIIPLILILTISYLLSCLIVWTYDKFRKRK